MFIQKLAPRTRNNDCRAPLLDLPCPKGFTKKSRSLLLATMPLNGP